MRRDAADQVGPSPAQNDGADAASLTAAPREPIEAGRVSVIPARSAGGGIGATIVLLAVGMLILAMLGIVIVSSVGQRIAAAGVG